MLQIFPSLISGDILHLAQQLAALAPYASGFHLDVMDFHFVPNLTWGPTFINAIRKETKLPLWVHLMVDDPKAYLPLLQLRPHDLLTFHLEAMSLETMSLAHNTALLNAIAQKNLSAGIAIKPTTPIGDLVPLLTESKGALTHVLLMSVEPGFSGQSLLSNTFERLKELVELRATTKNKFTIAIDGGVTHANIAKLAQHGAEQCAVGSAIFTSSNPIQALLNLQQQIT